MSFEGIKSVQQRDRYELLPLIEHELEWMVTEGETNRHPDPFFTALIYARNHYSERMLPETKRHYRKIMVVYASLVSPLPKDDLPMIFFRKWHATEINEFEGFAEDLSDMTDPWREAFNDVAYFLGDMDGEAGK